MGTFAAILLRSFAKCMAYGVIVVCALVLINTMSPSTQQGDASKSDCFDSSTGQIFRLAPGETCSTN